MSTLAPISKFLEMAPMRLTGMSTLELYWDWAPKPKLKLEAILLSGPKVSRMFQMGSTAKACAKGKQDFFEKMDFHTP